MKIIGLSVKRPVGVFMIMIGILALGFVSLKSLAIDLYPKMDIPIAIVSTNYSGAAPQEIEKLISEPLEKSLSSIEGIDTIQSQSMPNASMVILRFATGTDLDVALTNVREKVDQVKGRLPSEANDPTVMRFDPQQIPVMRIGLTGDRPEVLQTIADDQIVPFFERTGGVASVSVEGGKVREILVELDQARLAQYGLTANQVVQTLNSENQSGSAGMIKKGTKDLQVRIEGEYTSLDDIRNVLIKSPFGEDISLAQIATVKDTFKEELTKTKVNGKPAVVMSVLKKSDGNTVAVADGMYQAMKEIKSKLPDGVELSVILDTSTFIRDAMNSVVRNMITGGIFSILALFLFLRSMRSTIVIGISIPIAIISTFILMYFTGETLNILSMGGLALGIGMMVDNSIVILENIFKYREDGMTIKQAAVKGASELGSAVIASTTTSLVVFLPIMFVDGIAAEMFKPLAMVVMFSLFASLVVAITIVPMASSLLLKRDIEKKPSGFDKMFASFSNQYQKLLNFALGHRKTIFSVVLVAFFGSFLLIPFIGSSFIPAADQGQIEISVETPSGTTLAETENITSQIAAEIKPYQNIIETAYLQIGGGGGRPGATVGSDTATFTIILTPSKERNETTAQVVQGIDDKVRNIAGADISVSEVTSGFGGSGAPIQIAINGPESDVLAEIAEQVIWQITDINGVQNPESSAAASRPEINVNVNRDIASQYGLSYQQIMSAIELNFNGQVATKYREDGDEIDVKVILPEGDRQSISDLETMLIQTPSGTGIPISTVATITQLEGPVMIQRENGQRQVNVTSDVLGSDLGTVSKSIKEKLAKMNFPDGYSYAFGGQSQDMAESFQSLAMALVFSIFLVYLVMAVQFESFLNPFVIMFAMPTTFIGILVGLFVTGQPLSLPAFIGIIMLAGIVVNNAIVLVDYINILRASGTDRKEAILVAGPARLRPILMTTLTTVLGMVPLALGIGEGSESQQPMAVTIIFGLSFSTFFTLVFIPVMYTVIDDFSGFAKNGFKRNKKKETVEEVQM